MNFSVYSFHISKTSGTSFKKNLFYSFKVDSLQCIAGICYL